MKSWKLVLEMAPLLIFFAVFKFYDLMAATIALMIATTISIIIFWFIFKKVATMPLVTAVLVLIFGGLTLYFDDTFFIKIKPTIIYLLFASGLLGALAFKRPLMKTVLGEAVNLTEKGWFKMSLHWGLFFLFLAMLNEYVWRNFDEGTWVQFKAFALLPLTLVFSVAELVFIRHEMIDLMEDDETDSGEESGGAAEKEKVTDTTHG